MGTGVRQKFSICKVEMSIKGSCDGIYHYRQTYTHLSCVSNRNADNGDINSHFVTFSGVNHPANDYSKSNTWGWTVIKHHITNEGLFALEFSFFSWWRLIKCLRIHLIKQHATLKIKCHVQLLREEWLILILCNPFVYIFPSSY